MNSVSNKVRQPTVVPGIAAIKRSLSALVAGLMCLCACGCSTVSGGRPLPVSPSDREAIKSASDTVQFNVPLIQPLGQGNVRVYEVGFDGTMNDAKVDADDKKTVVGQMRKRAGMHYYPGPGTQTTFLLNWLDGLGGFSSESIADRAEQEFFNETQGWLKQDPSTEIRVFVTGFSRGAAIARHFMNAVTRDWPTKAGVQSASPQFYALLFDTVATGQADALELSLPPSVEYLVHLVASDEPRSLFIPTLDVEDGQLVGIPGLTGSAYPQRINLLLLPGAHSDIGNAYGKGIGALYRELSELLLFKLGLSNQNCWDVRDDPFLEGKHDSRGLLDLVLGRPIPNSDESTSRQYLPKTIAPRSSEERRIQAERLHKLSLANAMRPGILTRHEGMPPLVFRVKRQRNHLDVRPGTPTLPAMVGVAFSSEGSIRRLSFSWNVPDSNESSILISDRTWERLPEGEEVLLSYAVLHAEGKEWWATHVGDVWVDRAEITSTTTSNRAKLPAACKADAAGNSINPIQVFVISTPERN